MPVDQPNMHAPLTGSKEAAPRLTRATAVFLQKIGENSADAWIAVMCPRSGFTELRLARSGESLAGGPGLNWAGSRRSAWINVAGNEAAEDLKFLMAQVQTLHGIYHISNSNLGGLIPATFIHADLLDPAQFSPGPPASDSPDLANLSSVNPLRDTSRRSMHPRCFTYFLKKNSGRSPLALAASLLLSVVRAYSAGRPHRGGWLFRIQREHLPSPSLSIVMGCIVERRCVP